ncbi:allantoinase AllB [Actinomyces wuliandei]|uniref:allantoinase AllB n=1 Tax=Actinomyces wuliandei TaxID=2057743 RepID=UPI000FDBE83D|nr:allantoinase AllB [Actinomyces wuliandei]
METTAPAPPLPGTSATPSHHDLVVRSQQVVLPGGTRPAAVVVDGERITAVAGIDAPVSADAEVSVPGTCVLMPGLVDTHVHVNEPGRTSWEGYESATRAALAAGVTTIIDMPLNSSPPTTTVEALEAKEAATRDRLSVDVGLWAGAVPGGTAQLAPLWQRGVFGFKCFTSFSGITEYGHLSYTELDRVAAEVAELGAVLLVHAEDPQVLAAAPQNVGREYVGYLASRPSQAEVQAIDRVLQAARATGARVHILHLSSARALPAIRRAKDDGVQVTAETCPHYLTFAAHTVPDGATEYKCAPPLREETNRQALWEGLLDGTIDHVASDHSPCTEDLKNRQTGDFSTAWGGVSSVQVGPAAVLTAGEEHGVGPQDLVRWMATAPCQAFSIPGKGAIAAGRDADLVVMDPRETFVVDAQRLEHRNKVTPYHRRRLRGVVHRTFLRGRLVDRESMGGRVIRRC